MTVLTLWDRAGVRRLSLAALIIGSTFSIGCNSLTGLEEYALEATDDPLTEGEAAAGDSNGTTGGASVGIGDKPMPALLNCGWPESMDVGKAVGQTLPTGMFWEGYRAGMDPNGPPATVDIAEFFDCDGSKGVDAVVFDTSQFG